MVNKHGYDFKQSNKGMRNKTAICKKIQKNNQEEKEMSAMKEKFMELQEKTYKKLENMGTPRKTIFKFAEMLQH